MGGAGDVVKGLCLPFLCKKMLPQRESSPFSIGRALNSAAIKCSCVIFTAFNLLITRKLQNFDSRSCTAFSNCTPSSNSNVTDCCFFLKKKNESDSSFVQVACTNMLKHRDTGSRGASWKLAPLSLRSTEVTTDKDKGHKIMQVKTSFLSFPSRV